MEKQEEFENKNQDLKRLSFVRVVAIHALVCVSNLYEYAKQKSGPFKSTVGTVEAAVSTVVGPVYEKFKDVPYNLLGFLDKKVDETSHKFDEHAPAAAKQVISQAQDLVHKAAQKAQKLVDEARINGTRGALNYAAAEYKLFVLVNSAKLWVKLNHNSAFHTVAEKVIPTAANLSEKYNCVVKDMSGKGYPVVGYMPLIPVDELGEAVKQAEAKMNIIPTAANLTEKYNSVVKDMGGKGHPVGGSLPLVPVDELGEAVEQAEAKINVIPTAATLTEKYNSVVKDMAGKGDLVVGSLPFFPVDELGEAVKHAEARINVIPTAANLSEKYNSVVQDMGEKGDIVVGSLSLIPVVEIGEAVKQAEAKDEGHAASHISDSENVNVCL